MLLAFALLGRTLLRWDLLKDSIFYNTRHDKQMSQCVGEIVVRYEVQVIGGG
jgi:hypothetical protein